MKNPNNPIEYYVTGKSCVKNTICDFDGVITLAEIKEVKELHYGVDDEYANKEIKLQGILTASYEFKENPNEKHSGVFKGKLYTKWYLNSENKIEYDNIEFIADGYLNNAFVGTWTNYGTGSKKICNWADYRVPLANNDFDIGAGEFSPSEKYFDKGWSDYNPLENNDWWK